MGAEPVAACLSALGGGIAAGRGRESVEALVGCVAGASLKDDYLA